MKQEKLYGLGGLSLAFIVVVVAGLLSVDGNAVAKDEARVSTYSLEQDLSQAGYSELSLSGSAYNHSLLNRECLLADELICRDLN